MSLSEYQKIIFAVNKNYDFLPITKDVQLSSEAKVSSGKKVCFLRHDIDFSIENALCMAQFESENNIKSTYTVLLSGEFYNPFELKNRKALVKIISLGHEVGLHFDPVIYDITNEKDLDISINNEKEALEGLLSNKVEMFSFHNTTPFSMSCRKNIYADCLNVYSDFFHNEVEYISDSHGYWRFRSWQKFLSEDHSKIQILTHPIWWQPNNLLPPLETIAQFILNEYKYQMNVYNKYFSGQVERENVSLLTDALKKENNLNDINILNKYVMNKDFMYLLLSEKSSSKKLKKLQELVDGSKK